MPGPSHPYWLFQVEGRTVAGLRPIPRGRQRWIPYVAVEHIEPTIAETERLGGRLGQQPFDVSGVARMATIVDPHERVVGLWEANGRSGAERQQLPGSMWWVEMLAHDVIGATHFYSSLLGWKASTRSLGHLQHPYTVYSIGNESVGGAIKIQSNWGRVPERWQVMFEVTDLKRTIAQTEGLGGREDLQVSTFPTSDDARHSSTTASVCSSRCSRRRPAKAGHYFSLFIQLIETTIGALGLSTAVLRRKRPSRETAYCGLLPMTLVPVAR